MRKIVKPNIDISEIITHCLISMADQNLKLEIEHNMHHVVNAEIEYDDKKATNELYQIVRGTQISDIVTKKVLKDLYSERFSKKGNIARKYYDLLISLAPNGRCPQCGVRLATTLDHNLPKSKYPLLSVSSLNLIPSCTDCNKGKQTSFPRSSTDETIHPYYDDIENFTWLSCRVVNVKPFLIEYFVSDEMGVPQILFDRIFNHFNSFDLDILYKLHGIEEFSNRKLEFTKLFLKGGNELLRSHIEDGYLSRMHINRNSWQTAFYKAILEDNIFLNGGFLDD